MDLRRGGLEEEEKEAVGTPLRRRWGRSGAGDGASFFFCSREGEWVRGQFEYHAKPRMPPSESVEGISKCYEYHTIFSYLSNTQF
jgi:hypothetical protein